MDRSRESTGEGRRRPDAASVLDVESFAQFDLAEAAASAYPIDPSRRTTAAGFWR